MVYLSDHALTLSNQHVFVLFVNDLFMKLSTLVHDLPYCEMYANMIIEDWSINHCFIQIYCNRH